MMHLLDITKNRNQKALAVRVSNVSFTIHLNQIDTMTSCLMSDDELIKMGRLIIEQVKKKEH